MKRCSSDIARRYGSAACDLPAGHPGLHIQHVTGISWSTPDAINSWKNEDET